MNLEQIEQELLHLPQADRAKLAQSLLVSLEDTSESDISQEWRNAAKKRALDIDDKNVTLVSAQEVRRKAMTLLR